MRVLVLTSRYIWPLTDGGAIRDFNLLRETSRHHDVYLLCFLQKPEDRENFHAVEPYCKKIIGVDLKRGRVAMVANLLLGTLGSRPFIMREYWRPEMAAVLERVVSEERIDVIHAHFLHMGQYAEHHGTAGFVLDAHNLEHVLWNRLADRMRNPLKKLFARIQARKLLQLERWVAARTDVTVTLSDQDRDEVLRLAPGSDVQTVPNGADLEYFHPFDTEVEPGSIIYFGNLAWLPQADAVIDFAEEIFPRIVSRDDRAKLYIVGINPPESVRRLAGDRIVVTGFVDDIREYIARAAVVVMPLRIGAGTKHRIFQALAMEKAIVATTVAAEGMALEDSVNAMIADDSETFADRTVELLNDPEKRRELGVNGARLVREHHGWSGIYGGLDDVFKRAVSDAESPAR